METRKSSGMFFTEAAAAVTDFQGGLYESSGCVFHAAVVILF